MPVSKRLRRGYAAIVAVVCAASIAYAIHVNGETRKAELAVARAHQWEVYARATLAHRRQTAKSLRVLVRRYNKLARSATAQQRRLLETLAVARRHAQKAPAADLALDEYRSALSDEERLEIAATIAELRSLLAAGSSS
jgi:hypothetical protein